MKIKWWGHASFLITTDEGLKILTDPYNEDLPYARIDDKADYVTVSHEHFDHNAVDLLPDNPKVINNIKGLENNEIKVEGIASYHDDKKGAERGQNIIFNFEFDGTKLSHLGDLGHPLNEDQLKRLKDVDYLLIPVGGNYTINADQAYKIIKQIKPKVIIPMHYNTDILDFPIKGVDDFLGNFSKENIKIINNSELEITNLPEEQLVYVLDYVK